MSLIAGIYSIRVKSKLLQYKKTCLDLTGSVLQALGHVFTSIGQFLDPEADGFPRTRTVVAAICGLVTFFIIGGLTVKYPNEGTLVLVIVTASTIDAVLAILTLADFRERSTFLGYHKLEVSNVN